MKNEERVLINTLEKIAADMHPALERDDMDGWIVQFADGYTQRANSVLPQTDVLPAPECAASSGASESVSGSACAASLDKDECAVCAAAERVFVCEKLYAEHNQPCIFKMTDAAPAGLNDFLSQRGYKRNSDSDVMIVAADDAAFQERAESIVEPEEAGFIITSAPDAAWLEAFFSFEHRTTPKTVATATRQFELIDADDNLTALYVRLQMSGKDVAVASVVIEDGVLFLLNVVVDESVCGKGYGKLLVKNALEAGCDAGAEKLCLQVSSDNGTAIKLYESFGFKTRYHYWYMVSNG